MRRTNSIIKVLFLITLVVFLITSANVFLVAIGKIHLRSNTNLNDYIDKANLRKEITKARRGNIYDQSGNIIAQDIKTYNIIAILSNKRPSVKGKVSYVEDPLYTSRILASILDADEKVFFEYLTNDVYQTELGNKGRNISKEQKEKIESYNLPGIEFTESVKRNYPLGTFASYLVGYGQSDENGTVVGKMGVEEYLDEYLTGTDGYKLFQADKNGYILPGMKEETVAPVNGNDVYLTIDKNLQETLETAVKATSQEFKAEKVWAAVMEISTGRLLAVSQYPSFDPNVLEISDYNNYLSQYAYEPGSVFKSFVYAAAINEGVYDGEALVDSNTFYFKNKNGQPYRTYDIDNAVGKINNALFRKWGMIAYDFGLIYSSNVITSSILTEVITPEIFSDYVHKLGFFKKVETDGLNEVIGTENYKYAHDKLAMTYGQGSSVTMLQVLQAYSAILGDGTMVKPYFIDRVVNPYSNETLVQGQTNVVDIPITPETALQLQHLLYLTVYDKDGTARHYRIPETEIIAKTGTTQVAGGGQGYDTGTSITSVMIGLPADKPRYMIYYCFQSAYDNSLHARSDIIKGVIRKVAMMYNLTPTHQENQEKIQIKQYEMPKLINHSLEYGYEKLADKHLDMIVLGQGSTIIDQYPTEHQTISSKQKVFLLTEVGSFHMPNMIGWSFNEVIQLGHITGMAVKITGQGLVYEQSIMPDTLVSKDNVIEVFLK